MGLYPYLTNFHTEIKKQNKKTQIYLIQMQLKD